MHLLECAYDNEKFEEMGFYEYKTYGLPGTEKTVELRLSESAWAELGTVELSIWHDYAGAVQIARRVGGVMQATGNSQPGVKVKVDEARRAVILTMTVSSEAVRYNLGMYGFRADRRFLLIPGEQPEAFTPVIPADPGLSNFKTVNTYTADQFADVASTYWGAPNIAKAYELGLMRGTSAYYFSPEESVTVAETITMAARLHSIYTTGSENFVQSNIWYQTYVDYCRANGILKKDFDYNAPAKRSDFAAILAAALPAEALRAVNTVEDGAIPDVSMKDDSAEAVYALYRAGILTGNDVSGTFGPETAINRAAAAAILTRMADTSLRKSVTLTA